MAAGLLVHHVRMGGKIKACVEQLPQLQLEASIQPITRTVLRVKLTIYCRFRWNDKVSRSVSRWNDKVSRSAAGTDT